VFSLQPNLGTEKRHVEMRKIQLEIEEDVDIEIESKKKK
jgi:hypothetical protein